jgi:TusA-related sulfurtransferase
MQYQYDASNDVCPLPLVKLRCLLKKMVVGDTCLIKLFDKGSKQNIPKFLHKQGYNFTIEQNINAVLTIHIQGK